MSHVCVNTPAIEVILRHQDTFSDKQVLIAGDVQDLLPAQLKARSIRVHTAWFHHRQTLARALGEQAVQFGLVADAALVDGCDTLIYFWPKNKPKALFQMTNLLSLMPLGCDVFVVGENRSGVHSAKAMLWTCGVRWVRSIAPAAASCITANSFINPVSMRSLTGNLTRLTMW